MVSGHRSQRGPAGADIDVRGMVPGVTDNTPRGGPFRRWIEYVAPSARYDREQDDRMPWKAFGSG